MKTLTFSAVPSVALSRVLLTLGAVLPALFLSALLLSALLLSALLWPSLAQAALVADAAERGDATEVERLLRSGSDVNEPQVDGTTALHWAVELDAPTLVARLLAAGADPDRANRTNARPLQLAALNGSAEVLTQLLAAGADVNRAQTITGDTALMIAARTGRVEAVQVLLDHGAAIEARESWGGTTALMWAVNENQSEVVRLLLERGADVNAVSRYIAPDTGRGFEGSPLRERSAEEIGAVQDATGEFTPLMFAAREGHIAVARLLVEAGADVNALAADGKDALGVALFNGHYDLAAFLLERGSQVDQADAYGFTPLFWAVDRRNMETATSYPWIITDDPFFLVEKLLAAGADPNKIVNGTPRARMRGGSPRIVFASALMRAAFAGDLQLVTLLLEHGADPNALSSDNESSLEAAAGLGFVAGFHKERSPAERLAVVKLLVEWGADVNWQDDYGISPLMAAGNLGDVAVIQYLVDQGANLGAYDLGKKNDGIFGASIEPLMPIDYAIGVGTFRPNNAIIFNEPAYVLMQRLMAQRGIAHTTSECTLRGFTCSAADMDPRDVTPLGIEQARALQTGHQVDDSRTGKGLEVVDP
ncbi:MAG: ankyrin repeat domain-containing protein [Pseudomonadales bacterium]|jgi:ankyrin repeat protein|nr:ankyrin repeat domain-containing protein [Pseudomonadales bacterium]